mmetsp:Transcript_11253/g.17693  ORF Transcript_11253/g.17693 Transcript_11253/m.17693 type:complete len:108 (+) Transcript_11253:39-362(+)
MILSVLSGVTFAQKAAGVGDWTSCDDPWRCYIKHAGQAGVGPPGSAGNGWEPGLGFDCNYQHLASTITDESGSGGSATTGMCFKDQVGFTPDRPKGWVGKWDKPSLA